MAKAATTTTAMNFSVYANIDQAIIVWQYENLIDNCIGFSIFRKNKGQSDAVAEPLKNKVGFEGEPHQPGEQRPSTEWPIQRFTWVDFMVNRRDVVCYKIVPILFINGKLVKDETNASEWSGDISIDTGAENQAFFNRGVISSQFFTNMKNEFASELQGTSVKAIIGGNSNKVRDFLGGYLSEKLFGILDEIAGNTNLEVFGALYELQQGDLIAKLQAIGNRAHIVLANGSFKTKGEDKNEHSRTELTDAGVEVFDRIVDPGHFGHNKFLVIVDNRTGKKNVWTGSTNWTPGGLFSQVNNGIYFIDNNELADTYLDEWGKLKDAGNSSIYPTLLATNASPLPTAGFPHVWFSPKKVTGDLDEVSALMDGAKKGILFLMFNPGPKNTLFNKILAIQQNKPGFFVHGVINQDPGGKNNLIFFDKGKQDPAKWDDILPGKISQQLGFFNEEDGAGLVTIHSKTIVIDPFTDNATVITGSNNMGPKASTKNDDNLIIVKDKKLVEEYAVNMLAVYDHYRWRYSLSKADSTFKGLTKDTGWMKKYLASGRGSELKNFWFK